MAPTFPPTPGHCHVLYKGGGETRVGWHRETYCLVGGCRSFGDAPLATPAKAEAEKPGPRGARKRHRPLEESDEDFSCSSPKIWRLELGGKRWMPSWPSQTGIPWTS
ncbi:LOW QUALITY PROTEIN: DPEP2 neighbor protein [Pipistrellus kuhlii]|uniref:LOW QUALITY PROTEIN: DPEP2 neighbor protein n=1 Tax=Pipistrellus kuhlii TaxID=59472 RepID=UPI00174EFA3F|nr:LOW QUALITY PROTEIN: DPEP2 neighbor protein [Pipistrellus kuhlii]